MVAFYVLSTSKVCLYALVPMALEHTSRIILVATTSDKFANTERIAVDETHEHDYTIMYARDERSLEEFVAKMNSSGVRVGLIPTSSSLFLEMIRSGDGEYWFSACRDGIFTYANKMKEYIKKPTTILCFDNDEEMVERAKAICTQSNLMVYKCVVHSVCFCEIFDEKQKTVKLLGGDECVLYFPPEVLEIKKYLLYDPHKAISRRVQLRFTETPEEFEFHKIAKMIDVNALHTMVCVAAYVEGHEKGIEMDKIPDMKISSILDKSGTLKVIMKLHSEMFDKYLGETAMLLNVNKEVHSTIAHDFTDCLFTKNEIVGRGLDHRAASFDSKQNLHFPLLSSVEDTYVQTLLDAFKKLFQ